MPRIASATSIDEIVRSAIGPAVAEAAKAVAVSIAQLVAVEIEKELTKAIPQPGSRARRVQSPRRAASEMTRWVADRNARRVPTFVIEATGLDTKKKIVAKFGEDAVFEKGKPVPVTVPSTGAAAAPAKLSPRVVKAKPPIRRRAVGAK
jgi:hypothetical protein